MTADDVWRSVNLAMLLVAGVMFMAQLWQDWDVLPRSLRMYAYAAEALIIVAIIGTIEQIIDGTPVGVRTVFTSLAGIWLCFAAIERRLEGEIDVKTENEDQE